MTKERKAYIHEVFKVLEETGYFDDADGTTSETQDGSAEASAEQVWVPNSAVTGVIRR
jgi:hypothetical protein